MQPRSFLLQNTARINVTKNCNNILVIQTKTKSGVTCKKNNKILDYTMLMLSNLIKLKYNKDNNNRKKNNV